MDPVKPLTQCLKQLKDPAERARALEALRFGADAALYDVTAVTDAHESIVAELKYDRYLATLPDTIKPAFDRIVVGAAGLENGASVWWFLETEEYDEDGSFAVRSGSLIAERRGVYSLSDPLITHEEVLVFLPAEGGGMRLGVNIDTPDTRKAAIIALLLLIGGTSSTSSSPVHKNAVRAARRAGVPGLERKSVIKLAAPKPPTDATGNARGAGVALHRVRGFWRTYRGRRTFVSAYWRGDPAYGVVRSEYNVAPSWVRTP